MRTLSPALLAAQKQAAATPCVKVTVSNKENGVNRYQWTRLYSGSEDDYFHGMTLPGDGSLVRVRLTPVADSRKLYYQRIVNPGEGSNYSGWTYSGQYNAVVTAAASLGAEVSLLWIKSSREIMRLKSANYGADWGSPELIDYSPSTAIYGIAAAYKPNGDLAVFFADQAVLYQKKCLNGVWQTKTAWDKSTGNLSGVGCVYGIDWNLLVTGKDTAGNFKLWSLLYGDGGELSTGTWSILKEVAAAPSGGAYEYRQPFLDKTDTHRGWYVEKFTGNEAYSRPYYTYLVSGTSYKDGLWREPSPFNLSSQYGLAAAHDSGYGWLSSPGGVWRTALVAPGLDITGDVIELKQESVKNNGGIIVELSNDDGRYALPGENGLVALKTGSRLEFSPGYVTSDGEEYSEGQSYYIESLEHTSSSGKAALVIRAEDGWRAVQGWHSRQQFRWNKNTSQASVKDIIAEVLVRAGIKLAVKSQSAAVASFYPDFTVNPGDSGKNIIQKLLTYVPDEMFIEGNTAYLVNPQSSDNPVYGYGLEHIIKEGRYRQVAMAVNRVTVEGLDPGGSMILTERCNWAAVGHFSDRDLHLRDRNLKTVAETLQRGDSCLRQAEIQAVEGSITVPINCGQQLYDVIAITDERAGMDAVKKRVLGLALIYRTKQGEYYQRLEIGGV